MKVPYEHVDTPGCVSYFINCILSERGSARCDPFTWNWYLEELYCICWWNMKKSNKIRNRFTPLFCFNWCTQTRALTRTISNSSSNVGNIIIIIIISFRPVASGGASRAMAPPGAWLWPPYGPPKGARVRHVPVATWTLAPLNGPS